MYTVKSGRKARSNWRQPPSIAYHEINFRIFKVILMYCSISNLLNDRKSELFFFVFYIIPNNIEAQLVQHSFLPGELLADILIEDQLCFYRLFS